MGIHILVDSHSCSHIKCRMFLIKRDLTKNTSRSSVCRIFLIDQFGLVSFQGIVDFLHILRAFFLQHQNCIFGVH